MQYRPIYYAFSTIILIFCFFMFRSFFLVFSSSSRNLSFFFTNEHKNQMFFCTFSQYLHVYFVNISHSFSFILCKKDFLWILTFYGVKHLLGKIQKQFYLLSVFFYDHGIIWSIILIRGVIKFLQMLCAALLFIPCNQPHDWEGRSPPADEDPAHVLSYGTCFHRSHQW